MTRDCKHGQLARACDLCAGEREVAELKRWRSTNAPRLDALQGLLTAAQLEAHAGREAVATLASERAANALLTDEVERLRAALEEADRIMGHDDAATEWREKWAHLWPNVGIEPPERSARIAG